MIIKKINALVLDPFPIIVESITDELKKRESIKDVYSTNSMYEAIKIIKNENIGLVTLDITQENFNGLDLIKKIRRVNHELPILVISSYGYDLYSDYSKKIGANGYISKKESKELITDAITSILRGYTLFKNKTQKTNEVELSNREITVLNYLLGGYSNKEISELLSLSTKTISTYKSRIMNKYDATSLIDLIKINDVLSL